MFFGEQKISYDSMLAQSRACAATLQTELEVQPGDRVVLVSGSVHLKAGSDLMILHSVGADAGR